MNDWLISIMNQYGYLGVALLITVENVFPPIPSEVILTFSGFMTTYTRMHIPGVVISSTVGSLAGALILYEAGYLLTPERMEAFLNSRPGRLLRLKKEDIQKAMDWFDSKGNYTVFFCRFIPIVRSLISIPAGMVKMNFVKYTVSSALGIFLWNFLFVGAGYFFGEAAIRIFS